MLKKDFSLSVEVTIGAGHFEEAKRLRNLAPWV